MNEHVAKSPDSSSTRIPIVLITGVTRGLGRAMVDEFVRRGHKVLGCGRSPDQIEMLATKYPKHDFCIVDVASDKQVSTWARHLLTKYGPPDFVLNNAAIINGKTPLWEVGNREFSSEVDTNLKGVANVIRHFAPAMIERGRGVIVNFSSRWGSKFEKRMAPYCATKWAIVALTRVLAEELKSFGVVAIALNPGIVKTRMLQQYLGTKTIPRTSEYPTPAQWAKVAVPFILGLRLRDTGKTCKISNPRVAR
jgi:NAD(P)-dependent dehydrogenase (short-subunit alcohol dehydrogenase family)